MNINKTVYLWVVKNTWSAEPVYVASCLDMSGSGYTKVAKVDIDFDAIEVDFELIEQLNKDKKIIDDGHAKNIAAINQEIAEQGLA